jgi:hypothetical protein
MNAYADRSSGERLRLRAKATTRGATVAAILTAFAVTAAWDSPSPAGRARLTLLYVGAADCAPCRTWQRGDGAQFRESAEFARITYREVRSPTLREILSDAHWPEDLRGYRDQLGRHAGVPLWLVLGEEGIVGRGSGTSAWRGAVLPQIRSLVR